MIQRSNRSTISLFLMRAVIFLLPCTAFFTLMPSLNPYGQQLSFYPLTALLILLVLNVFLRRSLPKDTFKLMRPLFYVAIIALFSFIININSIELSRMQGRTGYSQFLSNFSQLVFGILIVVIFVFFLARNNVVGPKNSVIKAIDVTLMVLSLYCFFEVLSYQGIGTNYFNPIADFFHDVKYVGDDVIDSNYNYGRVKGFSQEPSHLGIIFSVYFPFTIFYNTKFKWYKVSFLLLMMVFTFSKTLYLIFVVEIFLYFFLVKNVSLSGKALKWFFWTTPFLAFVALTPVVTKYFTDASAVGRTFSQLSALTSWVDSKKYLFGEGIGQQGFYTIKGYNNVGVINTEFLSVLNGTRWPFIQNIHIKVLVEMGILGLVAWVYVYIFLIIKVNNIVRNKYKKNLVADSFGQATIVSVIGILFSGFSYENFSLFFTWIAFGMAFYYLITNRHYLELGN